jgi:hypothetical protein
VPAENENTSSLTLQSLASIVSPVALATALLFYFGWVRTHVQAQALGYDITVLGLSTQDLVLRSINVLFIPLVLLLTGAILAECVDRSVVRSIENGRRLNAINRFTHIARYAWLLMLLVGIILLLISSPAFEFVLPFLFIAALLGSLYAERLRCRLNPDAGPRSKMSFVAVLCLLSICLFWGTERIAAFAGQTYAGDIAANVEQLPSVAVYAPKRLEITVRNVHEIPTRDPQSAYAFRYDGLRLLLRSGDRLVMLYDGWNRQTGRVIMLPDTAALRLDFLPDQ